MLVVVMGVWQVIIVGVGGGGRGVGEGYNNSIAGCVNSIISINLNNLYVRYTHTAC